MKRGRAALAAGFFLALLAPAARPDLIWLEDFSGVADWSIIYNAQSDASSLTSDGDLGLFRVPALENEVAFGPTVGAAPLAPFNPAQASDYTMSFEVAGLSASVSYDIRLDLFDGASNYLSTVYGVVPQGTFVGADAVNLGSFTYAPGTAQILPKVSVFTGPDFPDQEVRFDEIRFDVVPEPSTALLGLLGLLAWRRRAARRAG